MDVRETAEFLGLTPATVYRWAESGVIPVRRFGRQVRFLRSDLLEWAKEADLPPAPPDEGGEEE